MNEQQRAQFIAESKGKTIASAEWDAEDRYWTFVFTDESEVSFRLMAELPGGALSKY